MFDYLLEASLIPVMSLLPWSTPPIKRDVWHIFDLLSAGCVRWDEGVRGKVCLSSRVPSHSNNVSPPMVYAAYQT